MGLGVVMRQICLILCVVLCLGSNSNVYGASEPFEKTLQQNAVEGSPEATLLTVASGFLSDQELEPKSNRMEISGRDPEADQLIDTLVRIKGAVPILIGPAGVGKTTTVQRAVQKVVDNEYPDSRAFAKVLDDAVWIQTSPGKIMKLVKTNNAAGRMAAIESICESVLTLEKKYKRKIVLYIDEIHTLESDQVEALLPYLDSEKKGIRLVGSTNSDKFQQNFKTNDAFLRRVHLIGLEEFSEEQVVEILQHWWVPHIQGHYRVKFGEHAIPTVVRVAPTLLPEAGRFDASIKLLQDLAIAHVRGRTEGPITDGAVYNFAKRRTGFPVNPHDSREVAQYLEELKTKLNSEIIDQPRMIDDVLKLFQSVIMGTRKGIGVGVAVGPTGTGKSELVRALARYGFRNPNALLSIDANDFKSDAEALKKLFGAEAGLVGFKESSGMLPEFLDDPSRGKYGGVILIDEGERASQAFWERLMEFFDTGSFTGGDGKRRYARRHLVIITSNRGDKILFPEKAHLWSPREMEARVQSIRHTELKNLFLRQISGRDNFTLPVPVLNRVDVYTIAQPITETTARKIVAATCEKFSAETKREFQVDLTITPELIDYLTKLNYNLRDGARPIIHESNRILQEGRTRYFAAHSVPRDSQLTFSANVSPTGQGDLQVTMVGAETLTHEMPSRQVKDPLADPEFRERLRRLPEVLREMLVGQEQVIRSVEKAVKAHFANPGNKRPLCIFVIGLTGTGKTLLGRAIAKALFGSEERAEVIPLGHITREEEFNSIFGSNPGFIGSDRERKFEDALRNHPTGGVVVWDEASNLGGGNPQQKESLFKKFYNLTDEGSWTSDATRETYDLSKEVFLFTGNDGEKLFAGITDDALRMSIWQEYNERPKVREILVANGVPQAFLGRMADTMLMKPLIRSEVTEIARQRLTPVIEEFRARGVEVTVSDAFVLSFAQAFYSPDMGARSLRSVAEYRVRGMLTEALIAVGFDPSHPEPLRLELDLLDLRPARAYGRPSDPERKVEIKIRAIKASGVTMVNEDLTEYADPQRRLSLSQAAKTAYHEAGHAIMNDPEITGEELRHLTILPSSGALGFASYREIPGKEPVVVDRKMLISRIARLLAGQIAMMLAGYSPDSGWSSDLSKVRSLATSYVRDWGMSGGLAATAYDKKTGLSLTDQQQEVLQKEIAVLIDEGARLAISKLSKNWPFMRRIVKELLGSGFITGEQFKLIEGEYRAGRADWIQSGRGHARCIDTILAEAGILVPRQ